MTKAPCGHADAECVIGNFWTCKSCGGESKAQPSDEGAFSKLLAAQRANPYTLPPMPTATMLSGTDQAIRMLASARLPDCAKRVAPNAVAKSPGAAGHRTQFQDPATGTWGFAYRNKLYNILTVGDHLLAQPKALASIFDRMCSEVVERMNNDIAAVVQSRGWTSYAVEHLGDLLHLIEDDGRVVRRCPELRAVEIGIRAYWVVVPA